MLAARCTLALIPGWEGEQKGAFLLTAHEGPGARIKGFHSDLRNIPSKHLTGHFTLILPCRELIASFLSLILRPGSRSPSEHARTQS